jgi:type I restriction enzyme S subunit
MSSKAKTTTQKPDGKPALTPKLRFPEFRDAEGWKEIELGQRINIKGRIGYRGYTVEDIVDRGDGAISLSPSNIDETGALNFDKATFISWAKYKESPEIIVERGFTLLVKTGSTYGKAAFVKELPQECTINPQIVVLKPTSINSYFLYLLVVGDVIQTRIRATVVGGAIPTLSQENISKFLIHVPTPAEQQKIAECLSSVDELIAAQARKLDALKTHKKGLMQQLFPREGETQPRLRFPEFQASEEWEPRTLGSVCRSFSGGTPSTSQPEYYGGDIPFIRSGEIGRDRTELFLTQAGLSNSAAKIVVKGDVLVALYGANSGDVALAKIDGAINQAILCLKSKESNGFIYQFLSFKKDWVVATYLQGGQGNLSGEIVKSISVCFPAPEEQQRIADCLTSLDDLIAAQTHKLEALKTHKKGLMQQLFPSPEEVEA